MRHEPASHESASRAPSRRRTAASPIGAWLFIALQRLLPQHALSRIVHRLARARFGPLKNALIAAFVRGFRPQMSEAGEPDPLRYASFNEFFTRSLKSGARRVDSDPRSIVSPVDGTVSEIGYLEELTLLQAKGRTYRLDALLASAAWTPRFAGGAYATLYLAPYDYHRIHMPAAAELRAAWYVPGRLFSVNATTAEAVDDLFARNERVVCTLETPDRLPFALVLVGALFVGSIATLWHGEVTPRRPRGVHGAHGAQELPLPASGASLRKGEEMGRFNMGSTVILLFPRDAVVWLPELTAGSRVLVGQPLARLRSAG